MAVMFFLFCGALIILLTLLQSVSMKIQRLEETVIEIDFIFIRVILYPKKSEKTKKQSEQKAKKKLSVHDKLSLLKTLVSHSDIHLSFLSLNTDGISEKSAPIFGIKTALISSVIAYFSSIAHSFSFTENEYAIKNDKLSSAIQFEITFNFSLLRAIITLLKFKVKERRYRFCRKEECAK